MGNNKLSRRNFFHSLGKQKQAFTQDEFGDPIDPLFQKYSRKKSGRRRFSQELISYEKAKEVDDLARQGTITSGISAFTGRFGDAEIIHLLKRVGYGFKQSKLLELSGKSVSEVVNTLMTIDLTPPPPPVNWYNNVLADENGLAYGADWTTNHFSTTSVGQNSNHYRMDSLRRWLFGLALESDHSIREKMVWFWFHFIPIDFEDIFQSSNTYINTNSARVFYSYMKLLRDNSLGNFKTLIRKISTEPAMMFYLNNQKNSATAPDENYARELMELFTLGKGPESAYTETDVVAAAKVLSGWRVQNLNTANIITAFVPASHNQTNKQFSAFFNNRVITNQPGAAGANELDQFIDMLFTKSNVVSKYICRRLYRYFVYYDIDDAIEANVIGPLAALFVNSNWDIAPVVRALLSSEHFYDMANRGVYIKSPFDLVAGTLRQFNINTTVSNSANFEAQYRVWSYYNDSISAALEQRMGSIPNVSGWNPFYQTPAFHEYWINTNSIQLRFKFLRDLINGYNLTYAGITTNIKIDNIAFAKQFGNDIAKMPDDLITATIKLLLPLDLSVAQKAAIKLQTLLSGQTTDSYWTVAWNNYVGAPTNTSFINVVESRLKSLHSTIIQLAEFQLM